MGRDRGPAPSAGLPAGPRGRPLVGCEPSLAFDSVRFLPAIHARYGDLVAVPRALGRRALAVFGPAYADQVTRGMDDELTISTTSGVTLADDVQLRGPLSAEGELHARYAEICRRALAGASVESYYAITCEVVDRTLDGWREGSEIDLVPELRTLSYRIFKYFMFGVDVVAEDPELDRAVETYISTVDTPRRFVGATLVRRDVPGISNGGTFRKRMALVGDRLRTLDRCPHLERHPSLGRTTLDATEAVDGERDTDLARDIVLQLYFAGLTAVPNTITWALLLLAQHPPACRRLLDELERSLGGRMPALGVLPNLVQLDAVLLETMRLYPNTTFEIKSTTRPLTVGPHELPPRSQVLTSPWVTQRSPVAFPEPLRFLPERFVDRRPYPEGSFEPWGVGSRICLGRVVARIATRLILCRIAQRWRLDVVAGQRIAPRAKLYGLRLNPGPSIRVRVAAQDGDAERSPAYIGDAVPGGIPSPAS